VEEAFKTTPNLHFLSTYVPLHRQMFEKIHNLGVFDEFWNTFSAAIDKSQVQKSRKDFKEKAEHVISKLNKPVAEVKKSLDEVLGLYNKYLEQKNKAAQPKKPAKRKQPDTPATPSC